MKKTRLGRRSRRGITLIDVMITVTIIAMFTGLVAVNAWQAQAQAQVSAAQTEVSTLTDALGMYRIKFRRFPTTAEGLEKLVEGNVIDAVPEDPWGHPYVYVSPGLKRPKTFDLYSKGPDGEGDTEDDVSD